MRKADALVVIVAHRYGWVPEDPNRNPEGKSITWLECEEAVANGKDVLAIVVDDHADWPADLSDKADLDQLMEWDDDEEAEARIKAIRKRIKQLKAFKAWLGSRGLRLTFKTKQELKLEVERTLKEWRPQPASPHPTRPSQRLEIPSGYQDWLERECADLTFSSSLKIQQGQALRLTNKVILCERSEPQSEPFVGQPLTNRKKRAV